MSVQSIENSNRALLLAAMHPEAHDFATLLRRHHDELDWDWLLERAAVHKVGALLAHRIETTGMQAHVPGTARERLDAASANASARYDEAVQDLGRVDQCLGRAGIPYILVKGPVLTQQVYEHPAQRHFFDLDIIVREAQVDAAQSALESLGYRLWGGDRYLGFAPNGEADVARATRVMRRSLKRFAHELALVTTDRSLLPIDVHWHLMPRGRIRAAAASHLWENSRTASVGGVETQVLGPEATVLHLAMHAWDNRPWSFALLHLTDAAWALQRVRANPEQLIDLANRWGARGDLGRTLYAVEHVLGVPPLPGLQAGRDLPRPSRRFRRIATPENLLEHCMRPAANGWTRLRQEIDWGLAMESLRSTALLLLAKYTALLRYRARRRG